MLSVAGANGRSSKGEWPIDGESFLAWVERFLVPNPEAW